MCNLSANKLVIGMLTTAREQHVYHSVHILSHFEYIRQLEIFSNTQQFATGM